MKTSMLSAICIPLLGAILTFNSCSRDSNDLRTLASSQKTTASTELVPDSVLKQYKLTPHQIYAGFYRFQGPCYGPGLNGSNFTGVPDSMDIVILFCFRSTSPVADSVPGWITRLHAKGTKVIVTGNLDLRPGATNDSVGYAATAKYIMDSIVNRYGFDGYDIDVETNPTGSTLTRMVGVYKALSKYMGPASGTGKLLTFDTNQNGSNNMFKQVYNLVDYVWLQAYGRGASTLQSTWNTFSPYIPASKFVPGFSFYEENGYPGNVWYDVRYPVNGTGRAYDYANWQPGGAQKGGVFSYAIDRDAPLTSSTDNTLYVPTYLVSRQLIHLMNP
ncbi:EndoS/ChiA family endoglycosidase [Chitinophaga jiangningensis]|nr:glycosyl hydrolase family 18 protein [Chitinophaga jiangningensis]